MISNSHLEKIIKKVNKIINEIKTLDDIEWAYKSWWEVCETANNGNGINNYGTLILPCFICGRKTLNLDLKWSSEWYQGSMDILGETTIACENSSCLFYEEINKNKKVPFVEYCLGEEDKIVPLTTLKFIDRKLFMRCSGFDYFGHDGLLNILDALTGLISLFKCKCLDLSCNRCDGKNIKILKDLSFNGKTLNGRKVLVLRYIDDKKRYHVRSSSGDYLVKKKNLKKISC